MSRASSPKTPIMSPDAVSVSPGQDQGSQDSSQTGDDYNSEDDYFKPLKRLRMMHLENHGRIGAPSPPHPLPPPPLLPHVPNNNNNNNHKPPTSFSIRDILSHKPKRTTPSEPARIVRPWDLGGDSDRDRRRPRSADDDSRSESDCSESPAGNTGAANSSPLDALFEMTSKAFEGLNGGENSTDSSRDHLHIFSNRQQPKKKRKSRTAFTNHQIFELEKRFLYQKYLSPADRDEIAQSLGLTNAQVITWFQNRRAKLKRDMEELKKDVDSTVKVIPNIHTHPHHHHNIMESIQDLSMMKADLVAKEPQ